jgi:hypothetical protein
MNEVPRGVKAVTVVIDMPIAAEVDGVVNKGCTADGEDR